MVVIVHAADCAAFGVGHGRQLQDSAVIGNGGVDCFTILVGGFGDLSGVFDVVRVGASERQHGIDRGERQDHYCDRDGDGGSRGCTGAMDRSGRAQEAEIQVLDAF